MFSSLLERSVRFRDIILPLIGTENVSIVSAKINRISDWKLIGSFAISSIKNEEISPHSIVPLFGSIFSPRGHFEVSMV